MLKWSVLNQSKQFDKREQHGQQLMLTGWKSKYLIDLIRIPEIFSRKIGSLLKPRAVDAKHIPLIKHNHDGAN